MATVLSGTLVAQQLATKLQKRIGLLRQQQVIPTLATIIVGNDKASLLYANRQQQTASNLGINYQLITLSQQTTEQQLLQVIQELNQDVTVDAILIQTPLPAAINPQVIRQQVAPIKDVEGQSAESIGRLWNGQSGNLPTTAVAIMKLLHFYQIAVSKKHVVIVGRSSIVGKPLAALLLRENATVTIAHSYTDNLASLTRQADILVVAIGKANFITAKYVHPGCIVIDVGTNRDATGKIVGDVAFQQVQAVAQMITPVPGGIGPLTVMSLLEQVVMIAERREKQHGR
ncbi:bifunctional methylenetetrahydrofolate dehydrogenase/methenyltetrahydrofolate cyclohydrolase [Bombilactobacillus bombi]|uniref:bifunctional 5,10-methylenetetrahydrofolate dehydrogenase/5,10-methenyltetrahydrofolate cyclohydrolase n=1 Tax=Bombilactobacillus bombi TaxID=1303590 RepID=UPI000E59586C|nr:tetrahydrofolate dehydrogenase/cyclohydrolase catalytic domain-containing protein [Bombilactobacillus bombi]AXX64331.1 bifunctional methylenetetrahydrofolate dehydrogenase/methenyltetrahydrofolate cyclohydrolase [Bombilactobacillus bombi]